MNKRIIFFDKHSKTRWPLTIFYENGIDTPKLGEAIQQILEYQNMAEKWNMLSDPTSKNIAFQLSQWKEKAILNEKKAADFDELWRENKQLQSDKTNMKRVIDQWKNSNYHWQQKAIYAEEEIEKIKELRGPEEWLKDWINKY